MLKKQDMQFGAEGKNFYRSFIRKIKYDFKHSYSWASGAVFGILLGFGMLFPNTQLNVLFPPIPIKAKYFVMGYGAIELYPWFFSTRK